MSELTEEQLKQQKLEAGRKKFEELKKKNKKKKDKKKDTKEASQEPELEGRDSVEAEAIADSAVNLDGNSEPGLAMEKQKPSENDVKRDEPEVEKETQTTQTTAACGAESVDLSQEPALPFEEPLGSSKESEPEPATEPELSVETSKGPEPETETSDTYVDSAPAPEAKTENQDLSPLFGESGPSFIETIQKAKRDDDITLLKQENQKLSTENSSLQEQLEQLKKDNRTLKLAKVDNVEQIETLQEQVKDLESKLAKARVDSSHSHGPYDHDDHISLSPTPSYQHPRASTFSQFNLNKNDSAMSLTEVRARLNKWKGWTVDMSSWRSVGSGPAVEL